MPFAPSRSLDSLLGLRFLAATHVALFHYGTAFVLRAPASLRDLRDAGYLSTELFFVLSGFLLTSLYGPKVARGELDLGGFWTKRFARLYPSYGLALLLLVPLAFFPAWGRGVFADASALGKATTGLAHLTLVQSWVPSLAHAWNIPGWSLSNEAFFYLAFPFIGAWLMRRRDREDWTLALLAVWGLSLVLPALYLAVAPDGFIDLNPHADAPWLTVLKFNPIARLPEFLFGMALARFTAATPARGPLPALALWGGAAGLLGLALAAPQLPYPLVHNGLGLPLMGAVVYGLAVREGTAARFLATPAMCVLGRASYPLYILQLPVRSWLELAFGVGVLESKALLSGITLGFILGLSVLVSRYVEPPLQRWMESRLDRGLRPAPQPIPTTLSTSRG